jgi:hypothetical protein
MNGWRATKRSGTLGLLILGRLAMHPLPCAADSLIDNFERPNSPAPWTFSNGPEFPGATGSLTAGVGHSGTGAHLAYDLSKGGNYVSASLTLPSPLSPAAIGFWVKSPPNITIALRVSDASGQTLQYNLRRPLENLDPTSWYQQTAPLDTANGWWGGATNGQVQYPIRQLTILAADPPQAGAVGAIDFDDVTAVSSTVFNLDPALQPLVPAPPGSGNLLPRLGVNIHFTSDNRALDAAHSAGLAWVRIDLTWPAVESSPGVYNWTAYDGLLNALQSRGMKALLILDYGNALYTGANNLPPTNAAAIQAFANYARAAARHFAGRGARFEIWNEPNGSGFWPPAANPTQYAALAAQTIPSLNQGDSNAPVVTGGLSGFDFNFFAGYLAQNGGRGANAIGVHPYDCNPPELLSDRLLYLRVMFGQYLSNSPPVWDTEWGFSSTWFGDGHSAAAQSRQAVLVAREFLVASAGGFPLIIYYDLRDDGTDPTNSENNFGLLGNDYSDKPAMQAVRTFTSVASGRRFSGFIHTLPSNLVALRFDGRTNLLVALWSHTPAGQVTITVPTNAVAMDSLGAPLTLLNWTNRLAWTLHEADGPIYISFPYNWQATNLAPVLPPISNRTVIAGATLAITNAATYQDAPPFPLTYTLLSSPAPPAGASINSGTGVFTWRPAIAQSGSTNTLGVIALDNGTPSLSATQTFTVTVLAPAQPTFTRLALTNGTFRSWVTGDPGPDYSTWRSTNLLTWTPVLSLTSPALPFLFSVPAPATPSRSFYRAQLGP